MVIAFKRLWICRRWIVMFWCVNFCNLRWNTVKKVSFLQQPRIIERWNRRNISWLMPIKVDACLTSLLRNISWLMPIKVDAFLTSLRRNISWLMPIKVDTCLSSLHLHFWSRRLYRVVFKASIVDQIIFIF